MNLTYIDSPNFLSNSLHVMTCFEIPVHVFGVYVILCRTPESMKTVKWSMFNVHFWCVSLDLSISLMTTPFVLFPAIAGFPLGILKEIGVSTAAQIYIVVLLFAVVGVSILGIFENRFFVLFAGHTVWRSLRIPFFVFNYSVAILFFIPPYLSIPNQEEALKKVYQKLPPNLPPWIVNAPVFVLTTDIAYAFISVLIVTVLFMVETLVLVVLIAVNMKYMTSATILSKATLKIRRKFLNVIHLQMYTPLVILIAPLAYIGRSVYFNVYNQAANNVCFIAFAFHGLVSTTMMLLMHKPYRDACISILYYRVPSRITPVVEARRTTFPACVPSKSVH